jgi:hypothetical protein
MPANSASQRFPPLKQPFAVAVGARPRAMDERRRENGQQTPEHEADTGARRTSGNPRATYHRHRMVTLGGRLVA